MTDPTLGGDPSHTDDTSEALTGPAPREIDGHAPVPRHADAVMDGALPDEAVPDATPDEVLLDEVVVAEDVTVAGTPDDGVQPALPSPTLAPARPEVEEDPYPAAARPSFDIPISAPVSAHAPVVLQRVSAPLEERSASAHEEHAPSRAAHRDDDRPTDGSRGTPPTRRATRRNRVAVTVLSVFLVAALGGAAYLAVLANEWEQRSGEWEAQSRDLGTEVAELTGEVAGMTSELSIVRDQLATAQARITELADEKAQVGDDRESQKILADDVQEVAETALDVSAALGDCITAQTAVIGYLTAPETTTPEALQTAATQADTVCAAAVDDYNSLQQDLADS